MRFILYKDSSGYWRWQLLSANNRIIADSGEGYNNKQDCEHGIDLVKSAWNAPVFEA